MSYVALNATLRPAWLVFPLMRSTDWPYILQVPNINETVYRALLYTLHTCMYVHNNFCAVLRFLFLLNLPTWAPNLAHLHGAQNTDRSGDVRDPGRPLSLLGWLRHYMIRSARIHAPHLQSVFLSNRLW